MSIRTSTRKLWNAFDKARFECDEARRMYGEESEEYKLADKIMDDAYNVYTAFCEWGTRLRGCWFCWNDMQVVKEDRDYMLTLPGVDPDEEIETGIPEIMQKKVRIARFDNGTWGDDDEDLEFDLVTNDGAMSEVVLDGISYCPYCGRKLEEEWAKNLRNNDTYWDTDDCGGDGFLMSEI
jgi:hypothetical protein